MLLSSLGAAGRRIELNDTPHLLLVLHHLEVVDATDHRGFGRRVVNVLGGCVDREVIGGGVGGCWGRGDGLQLGLMLCDLREALLGLPRVAEADRLDEVGVLNGAVGAGDHVTVVAVEVQWFHRMKQRLVAGVALGVDRERERRDRFLLVVKLHTIVCGSKRQQFVAETRTILQAFIDIDSAAVLVSSFLSVHVTVAAAGKEEGPRNYGQPKRCSQNKFHRILS